MNIAELRKIAAGRTPGTWVDSRDGEGMPFVDSKELNICYFDKDYSAGGDSAFIAMASNNIDQILDRLEVLEKVREAAEKVICKFCHLNISNEDCTCLERRFLDLNEALKAARSGE